MNLKSNKCCARCGDAQALQFFHRASKSTDGRQSYCKSCKREYYREYIVPALRGRGKDHVLPAWLRDLVKPPLELPGKIIHLADYIDPISEKKAKHLVVGGAK